jgi:hypothetical protein
MDAQAVLRTRTLGGGPLASVDLTWSITGPGSTFADDVPALPVQVHRTTAQGTERRPGRTRLRPPSWARGAA